MSEDEAWQLESITLVRHGESRANTGELVATEHGDHAVPLSDEGIRQATAVGARLVDVLHDRSLVYCSPYLRTRQTLEHVLRGAGLDPATTPTYEDPRLREVEHGYGTAEGAYASQAARDHARSSRRRARGAGTRWRPGAKQKR